MTTGQFPKRRETDRAAKRRVEKLSKRHVPSGWRGRLPMDAIAALAHKPRIVRGRFV